MKQFMLAMVIAAAVAALPMSAQAQSLGIGDAAPKVEFKEFVKGEPVTSLEKGKLYVVEFWATWCGPCIQTIPHLTEMQKKHKDVTFIGVSVFENDQSKVKPFVEKMGEKMDYRVAVDSVPEDGKRGEGFMAKHWMEASKQGGIPTAFIINKDNKVAWIGHPGNMEKILDQVVDGKWDIAKAIQEHKEAVAAEVKMRALNQKLQRARQSGDTKELLAVIEEATKDNPVLEKQLAFTKFRALSSKDGDMAKALELGNRMVTEYFKDNANELNQLAWNLVDPANPKMDAQLIKLALKAAMRGDEINGGKDPAVADTLGAAYFAAGNLLKAVETQERANKHAKGTQFEKEIAERLEQYKKAAEKQNN